MSSQEHRDFDPHNLPGELLIAIGLAVASASQTESIVGMAIGGCLGLDAEYTLATSTHLGLPLKLNILRSAAEIRIDDLDDLDTLDELIERIEQAFKKRNEIVHQSWCRNPETNELFRVKEVSRVRVEADWVPVAIDDVRADAEAIYKSGIALLDFLARRDLIPPVPKNLRPRGHKSREARKRRNTKLTL